ncbi:PRC-barrel domain-containing protein [Jannaschia sp. 2305UL9-9]|uniref:PRC-barrel domain-containing protein n=1 Tax=Jannaschia sp. 2305UL9-9 TaxID=3121638 RepID=UPI003528E87C
MVLRDTDIGTTTADRGTSSSKTISSDEVNGTAVYNTQGENVGHIDHLMIDKVTGRVAYAVMHFGGFLGMGEESHPIPWEKLEYDTTKHGYLTNITPEQLQGAPRRSDGWRDDDRYRDDVFRYYNTAPYWL